MHLRALLACVAAVAAGPGVAEAKKPNFVVSSAKIKVSQIPTSRDFVVTTAVKNTGRGEAPKSVTELSLGAKPEDGGVPIDAAQKIKSLDSGKRFVVRSKVPAPEATSEPMVVFACADGRDQVPESNEDDNCTETKTELGIVPDGFTATASGEVSYGDVTERWGATISLVPSFEGPYSTSFGISGGTVNWQVEGTVPCGASGERTIEGQGSWPYFTPSEPGDFIQSGALALHGPDESAPRANTYGFQIAPGGWPTLPRAEYGPCGASPAETRGYYALNCTSWDAGLLSWEGEFVLAGQRDNYETRLCADPGEAGLMQSFNWSIVRN